MMEVEGYKKCLKFERGGGKVEVDNRFIINK